MLQLSPLPRLVPFIFLLLLPGVSNTAFAALEGTYTGNASVSFQCNSPSVGPYTSSASVLLIATGSAFTLSIKDAGGRYAYDGSGNISQSGTSTFLFNATGKVQIKVGNANIDGTYDPSFLNFSYEQSGDQLSLINGPAPENNIMFQTPCGDISLAVTLADLVRGGQLVVTAETPGSSVTDAILFNTQIQGTVSGISNRITGALSAIRATLTPRFSDNSFKLEGQTGLNSGSETGLPFAVWGNYSYTDYENDLGSTAFEGSSHGFLGGIDMRYREGTVIGVALGFDNADIDTVFNGGKQNTDTFTIAPYFGALLGDSLSIDFNLGYSYVDYEQYRSSGSARVTSSPRADRWFGALNLNTVHFIDRWIIGGRVGALYASSVIEGYTESNGAIINESRTRVSTVSVAGDVAYSYGDFEPFLNISYQYDYQLNEISAASGPQPSNDKDDILLTTGLRYFEQSGISGNIEYSKRLARDNFDEDRLSLTLRVDY